MTLCPKCEEKLEMTREFDGRWITVLRCPNHKICGYEEEIDD